MQKFSDRTCSIRHTEMSKDAERIYDLYQVEFNRRWGIDSIWSELIGGSGKQLFAAEFSEHGEEAYRRSVVLPIRNAYYQAHVADERWETLSKLKLSEPILDYGCGVGYLCSWLKSRGFNKVYGYDLSGIQFDVAKSVGVVPWNKEPVNTILCINVLEHLEKPKELLRELIETGARIIANVCEDEGEKSHVASIADMKECKRIIQCVGYLYENNNS